MAATIAGPGSVAWRASRCPCYALPSLPFFEVALNIVSLFSPRTDLVKRGCAVARIVQEEFQFYMDDAQSKLLVVVSCWGCLLASPSCIAQWLNPAE